MADMTIGEAARALNVSADTLRRWDRAGKLKTERDERNRRVVPRAELKRLRPHPERHRTGDSFSARNRFPGRVVSVESDGVMALVEIEAGPFRVTAAVTRDALVAFLKTALSPADLEAALDDAANFSAELERDAD